MAYPEKIDLHMHSRVSDGTDTPSEIVDRVREKGIEFFSLTDHDAVKGCVQIMQNLKNGDPHFVCGAEFSCKDEMGNYHILAYGYDAFSSPINGLVETAHELRIAKFRQRMKLLSEKFGFGFDKADIDALSALDNPGKPHIGNLMVKYGYARNKDEAINEYINKIHVGNKYVRPEYAINAILNAGGIPVLAHPSFGRGDELVIGDEMDGRLKALISYGLKGVEAFYSGFNTALIRENLAFAEKYGLFVTAGSDYHGTNKTVVLGDDHLPEKEDYPDGFKRFLAAVGL